MRRLAIWLMVIGLAAPGSAALGAEETPTELPESGIAFGAYQLVPLGPDGTYAGPPLPADLEGIPQADLVAQEIDPAALAALTQNGFVVVPDDMARFHMAYESQVYEGRPVFVTTDAAYDTWHLVFDKLLRDLEGQVLLPRLQRLAKGMLERAQAQEEALAGTDLAAPAGQVTDLMRVVGTLLRQDVGRLSDEARAELQLIRDHAGNELSPILGTFIDYSLYAPRGHYTLTPKLRRYFQAMSVLGQTAFLLPGSRQIDESVVDDPSGLRLALLASRTLIGDPKSERLWKEVYEPSSFLVGVGDDYTPFELAAAVEATVPEGMADPALVADDANLEAVAAALRASREVQIDSERPSVRLMGTRFVIDSWVLDQLIWPNVGTEDDRRKWPSPLDLAAAFGSEVAYSIQEAAGETAYANYPEQMSAMRTVLDARPDEAWGGTVYDAWLAALEPMWLPHGEAFPGFMRTPAWDVKAQQTGLGSYSELRHDTILYVKQAVGELGDAGPPEVVVRHWVEPDPVPFQRLAAVATLTRDGLAARGLLDEDQTRLLDDYVRMVERFGRLASAELAGEAISERDNEWLKTIGGRLESLWWRTSDQVSRGLNDDLTATIADIAAADEMAVEIGTGYVDRIYVLVPDDEGHFQIATGGVYSYYEFLQPVAERLDDETWRQMLADGEQPPRPTWEDPIFD